MSLSISLSFILSISFDAFHNSQSEVRDDLSPPPRHPLPLRHSCLLSSPSISFTPISRRACLHLLFSVSRDRYPMFYWQSGHAPRIKSIAHNLFQAVTLPPTIKIRHASLAADKLLSLSADCSK